MDLVKQESKLERKIKHELGMFKIVISKDEATVIDDLLGSLEKIYSISNCKPNIFTFYSNYYTSNVVMRSIKFGKLNKTTPMKKYAIIDLKASLGNYNNLFDCFNYLGISNLTEKLFYTEELEKDALTPDKKLFREFFTYTSNKIFGLAKLTSSYLNSTYGNNFIQNIVIDIETHADLSKKDEFLKKFPKYKEESEEDILSLMSRNPLYNVLYGYSLCVLN